MPIMDHIPQGWQDETIAHAHWEPANARSLRSRVLFDWVAPLLAITEEEGAALRTEQLPPTLPTEQSDVMDDALRPQVEALPPQPLLESIARATLFASHLWMLVPPALLAAHACGARLLGALAEWTLVGGGGGGGPESPLLGLALALGLSLTLLAGASLHHLLFYESWCCGLRARVGLTVLIYEKGLRLSQHALASMAVDQLIELATSELQQLDHLFLYSFYAFWAPLEALLVHCLVALDTGVAAFYGLVLAAGLTALQVYLTFVAMEHRAEASSANISRINLVSEVIEGVVAIKSHCWETEIEARVNLLRRREALAIKQTARARWLCDAVGCAAPAIGSAVVLMLYDQLGGQLSAPLVLRVAMLEMGLAVSLNRYLPWGVRALHEGRVTCERVQGYFDMDEVSLTGDRGVVSMAHLLEIRGKEAKVEKAKKYQRGGGKVVIDILPAEDKDGALLSSILSYDKKAAFKFDHDETTALILEGCAFSWQPIGIGPDGKSLFDGDNPLAADAVRIATPSAVARGSDAARNYNKELTRANRALYWPRFQGSAYGRGSPDARRAGLGKGVGFRLNIPTQQLTCIVGPPGSGKSSLVHAIAGELSCTDGRIILPHGVRPRCAIAEQEPWVMKGTYKENILFQEVYDSRVYKDVVGDCALEHDIAVLPDGDQTIVGTDGFQLSAAQCSRLALGRAVYAALCWSRFFVVDANVKTQKEAEVVALIDNVFGHSDKATEHHILNRCVAGLLGRLTRVVVTTNLQFLNEAALVIVLSEDGHVSQHGTFAEVMASGLDITAVLDEEQLIHHYEDVFAQYDKDESGVIDTDEFAEVMESMGHKHSDEQLKVIMKMVDADASGAISFVEFMEAIEISKKSGEVSLFATAVSFGEQMMLGTVTDDDVARKYARLAGMSEDEMGHDLKKEKEEKQAIERQKEEDRILHAPAAVNTHAGQENSVEAMASEEQKLLYGEQEVSRAGLGDYMKEAGAAVGDSLVALSMLSLLVCQCIWVFLVWWFLDWSSHIYTVPQLTTRTIPSISENKQIVNGSLVTTYTSGNSSFTTTVQIVGGLAASRFYYATALLGAGMLCAALSSELLRHSTSEASRHIHAKMLHAVLRAPVQFFDVREHREVLDRFSGSLEVLDGVLPTAVSDLAQSAAWSAVIIVLAVSVNPPLILLVVPFGLKYRALLRRYISASRRLAPLEQSSRMPVRAHFGETLSGASTIRHFGASETQTGKFDRLQDDNTRVQFASGVLSHWLGVRVQLLCWAFTSAAIVLAALTQFFLYEEWPVSGQLVMLSVLFLTQLNDLMQSFAWQVATVEGCSVSLAQALEYCDVAPEADLHTEADEDEVVRRLWPTHGVIQFKDYVAEHAPGMLPCVTNLSIKIPVRCKCGIVGPTLSGKSSLVSCLLRLLEPRPRQPFEDGPRPSLQIDGVDVLKLGLHRLRGVIAMIPPTPWLFSGTLRENLDPTGDYEDEAIRKVVERMGLTAVMEQHAERGELEELLDVEVVGPSVALSAGQMQLICVGRALLKRDKVKLLICDEPTASKSEGRSIDRKSEGIIQDVIRSEFRDCTVLTVSARLQTVVDSELLLVLDAGWLVEFGHPYQLLTLDPLSAQGKMTLLSVSGAFKRMCFMEGQAAESSLLNEANRAWTALTGAQRW